MSAGLMFLRRTVNAALLTNPTSYTGSGTGLFHEYLFLPADGLGLGGDSRLIAPNLPGNNSSTVSGFSSPNFVFNIGMNTVEENVSGTVQPLQTSQQATDPATATILDASTGSAPSGIAGATHLRDIKWTTTANRYPGPISAVAFTSYFASNQGGFSGSNHRDALIDFWADQGARGVSDIRIGWPSWNVTGNRKVDLIYDGVPYRTFNCNISKPDIREVAGQVDYFDYRFVVKVGRTL